MRYTASERSQKPRIESLAQTLASVVERGLKRARSSLENEPTAYAEELLLARTNTMVVPIRYPEVDTYREELINQLLRLADAPGRGDGWQIRPHQHDALLAAAEELRLHPESRGLAFVHTYGAGKGALAALMLLASWRAKQNLGLAIPDVLTTSERAVAISLQEEVKALCPELPLIELDKPLDFDVRPEAVLLRVGQWLSVKRHDLTTLFPLAVGLLIGDEADLATSPIKQETIQQLAPLIRMGMSATERVGQHPNISRIWGPVVHRVTPAEGIFNGLNVPPLLYLYGLDFSLDDIPIQRGDFAQRLLTRAMTRVGLRRAVLEIYEQLVPSHQRPQWPTIVFVPSTRLVKEVAGDLETRFAADNIKVRYWLHADHIRTNKLKADIAAFNAGEIDVLIVCGMGGRGINLLRARLAIHAAPSRATRARHQLFRVLRAIHPQSPLAKSGFKKPYAVVAQVVPTQGGTRPILLSDVIGGEHFRSQGTGGNLLFPHGADGHAQAEIDRLAAHLAEIGWRHTLAHMMDVDVYQQLQSAGDVPRADHDGFFTRQEHNQLERCGNYSGWRKLLAARSDEWPRISAELLLQRLATRKGMDGRDHRGQIRPGTFYSEKTVREVLADCLALREQQAEADGFFVVSGVRYATILDWTRYLYARGRAPVSWTKKVNQSVFAKYLKTNSKALSGLTAEGWLITDGFYGETDVERTLAVLTRNKTVLVAGPSKKEELYGSVSAWAKHFQEQADPPPISEQRIYYTLGTLRSSKRFEELTIDRDGIKLYAQSLIYEIFADVLLQHKARATDGGSYFHPNPQVGVVERFAPEGYWLSFLHKRAAVANKPPCTASALYNALRRATPTPYTLELPIENGRSSQVILWPESAILALDLMKEVTEPLETEVLYKEGEDYQSAVQWATLVNTPMADLWYALRETNAEYRIVVGGWVDKLFPRTAVMEFMALPLTAEAGVSLPEDTKLGNIGHEANARLCVWVQQSRVAETILGQMILDDPEVAYLIVTDEEYSDPAINHWRIQHLAGTALLEAPRARLSKLTENNSTKATVKQRRTELLALAENARQRLKARLKTKPPDEKLLVPVPPGLQHQDLELPPRLAPKFLTIARLIFRIERGELARQYLELGNGALIIHQAYQFNRKGGRKLDPDDPTQPNELTQESQLGLRVGIERYIPGSSSATFAHYACMCIFTQLFHYWLQVKFPNFGINMRMTIQSFYKRMAELKKELAEELSEEELIEETLKRVRPRDRRRLRRALLEMRAKGKTSKIEPAGEGLENGEGQPFQILLQPDKGEHGHIESVREAVSSLPPDERAVIEGSFGFHTLPKDDQTIAAGLGLQPADYDRLKRKAFDNLRKLLEEALQD